MYLSKIDVTVSFRLGVFKDTEEECGCVSLSVGEVIIKTIEERRSRREL